MGGIFVRRGIRSHRSGPKFRELSVRLDRLSLFVPREFLEDGLRAPSRVCRRHAHLRRSSNRPPPETLQSAGYGGENIKIWYWCSRHRARAQMPQPNCFFAVSDIISGVHGGSQTMFTVASLTP